MGLFGKKKEKEVPGKLSKKAQPKATQASGEPKEQKPSSSKSKQVQGIGIGMGDSLLESLVKMGTKCRKCGSEIIFEDGAACARKNGKGDNVVMCKRCRSVYKVDLSPSGMSLTTDVSDQYK